mmetsp:Transcript_10282/g.36538  ORF Transcript_10282/g.36538 Transcript_10282/m.36538 type:complete len:336 (-) Transcript_10282:1-1008(-)
MAFLVWASSSPPSRLCRIFFSTLLATSFFFIFFHRFFVSTIAASTSSRTISSTSLPWKPTSVNLVASTLTKGASAREASLLAISVLPHPVGPIIKMFLGAISFLRASSFTLLLLHLFRKAIETLRFASPCPTIWLSNSSHTRCGVSTACATSAAPWSFSLIVFSSPSSSSSSPSSCARSSSTSCGGSSGTASSSPTSSVSPESPASPLVINRTGGLRIPLIAERAPSHPDPQLALHMMLLPCPEQEREKFFSVPMPPCKRNTSLGCRFDCVCCKVVREAKRRRAAIAAPPARLDGPMALASPDRTPLPRAPPVARGCPFSAQRLIWPQTRKKKSR